MTRIQEIEQAILQLSTEELAAFRRWFAETDATIWERQIAEDAAAGRLDALADEAIADFRNGRCTDR